MMDLRALVEKSLEADLRALTMPCDGATGTAFPGQHGGRLVVHVEGLFNCSRVPGDGPKGCPRRCIRFRATSPRLAERRQVGPYLIENACWESFVRAHIYRPRRMDLRDHANGCEFMARVGAKQVSEFEA
jgi:hypothetical protein